MGMFLCASINLFISVCYANVPHYLRTRIEKGIESLKGDMGKWMYIFLKQLACCGAGLLYCYSAMTMSNSALNVLFPHVEHLNEW